MNQQLQKIQQTCISRNLPFVSFRLPQQEECITYVQEGPPTSSRGSLRDLVKEAGFVMAPFDSNNGHPYLSIRPDQVIYSSRTGKQDLLRLEKMEAQPDPVWPDRFPVVTGREKYLDQVNEIKNSIANGAFQKAVLSRIKVLEGSYFELVPLIYQEICRRHPNAFAYLFKSGEHFWMGASPEPLLRLREGNVSTVSLAGTRPYAKAHMDVNRWTMKEVLEQEYVTRYIHDVLHSFGIKDYRVSSPYVKKAGNLVHLRTDFSLEFDKINGKLWDLVEALHPTPAVAGQPKDDAIRFIRKLEPHDRDYYTGFLGPLNNDREIDLFVNLRCMKIMPDHMALYVGGGVTLDSDPAGEYDETTWKVEALLKNLQRFISKQESGHEASSTYS